MVRQLLTENNVLGEVIAAVLRDLETVWKEWRLVQGNQFMNGSDATQKGSICQARFSALILITLVKCLSMRFLMDKLLGLCCI